MEELNKIRGVLLWLGLVLLGAALGVPSRLSQSQTKAAVLVIRQANLIDGVSPQPLRWTLNEYKILVTTPTTV